MFLLSCNLTLADQRHRVEVMWMRTYFSIYNPRSKCKCKHTSIVLSLSDPLMDHSPGHHMSCHRKNMYISYLISGIVLRYIYYVIIIGSQTLNTLQNACIVSFLSSYFEFLVPYLQI